MNTMIIRKVIQETLLLEELSGGKLATMYHGSRSPPDLMIPVFLQDKFVAGKGAGAAYGLGLYGAFTLNDQTGSGGYGKYIYKLRVNLDGFISAVPEVTKLIYGQNLDLIDQLRMSNVDEKIIKYIIENFQKTDNIHMGSPASFFVNRFLAGEVNGFILNIDHIAVFNPRAVYPIAWKEFNDESWNKIDVEDIKKSGALERMSHDQPIRRYEKSPALDKIKRANLFKQVVKSGYIQGDLKIDLESSYIQSLPDDIHIDGSLIIDHATLIELPDNLTVGRDLIVKSRRIARLPMSLDVMGSIDIKQAGITSIPSDIKIGGSLSLGSATTHLPENLRVPGVLNAKYSNIDYIPENLFVGGDLFLSAKVQHIPSTLHVGGNLYLSPLSIIKSVGSGARVDGKIWGISENQDLDIFPQHLIEKIYTKLKKIDVVDQDMSLDDAIDEMFK